MAWFSPFTRDVVDLSDLTAENLQPEDAPDRSLLDRGRSSVEGMLDKFRADERALVAEIADKTEQLRQTRVAIEAFEAAERIMTEGDTDFAEVDPASPVILHRHEAIQS